MPTRSARVKRVPVPCSLPPDLAQRLAVESDERDYSSSVLIERALIAMFARFDGPNTDPSAIQPNATSNPTHERSTT